MEYVMDRVKRALRQVFDHPLWQAALIAALCFALLVWVLSHPVPPIVGHIAYLLSVCGLVLPVTAVVRSVPAIKDWLNQSPLIHSSLGYLIIGDASFRAWLGLCLSIAWNLIYALAKLIVGAAIHSSWLILMGVYYLMLALLRLVIVRPVGNRPSGETEPGESIPEWRRYRLCGALLLLMNQVLVVIVVQLVTQRGQFNYPGAMIYLMAAYTVWAVVNATVKLARYHRREDPLMSAAKAISLTAALVSTLSLETAMISRFGSGDILSQYLFTGAVGTAVCLVELIMAIYMIRHGGKVIARARTE